MKLTHGLVLVLCLVQLACLVHGKKKARAGRKDWRMVRFQRLMSPMQEEIKQLQETVGTISNPVHIHLHGVSGVDATSLGQLAVRDKEEEEEDEGVEVRQSLDPHGHHGKHHKKNSGEKHHKHHKHPKHGKHHKKASAEKHKGGKSKKGGHGGSGETGSEEDSSEEDSSSDEDDDDDDDEDEEEGANQSHIHVHVNVAGGCQGQGQGTWYGDYHKSEYIYACCHVTSNPVLADKRLNIQGNVYLRQKPDGPIEVKVKVDGFPTKSGKHGFHVHEFGDLSSGCNSFGGHYNPSGVSHGGPGHDHKHAGDWGNLETDSRGSVEATFNQTGYLYGPQSILGRGIVIHEHQDDHGMGGTHSSKTTGSAGARIGCCVISHCKSINWVVGFPEHLKRLMGTLSFK